MKNKIKIIFVDIDWTIYDHSNGNHVFDLDSIEALKRCQQKGILVFLCTARPYHSTKQTGLLDIFNPDGMILCNGGIVIKNNEIIYEKVLNPELFEKMCEVILSHHLTLEASEPFHRFLIAPKTDAVDYVFESFFEEMPEVEDYHNRHVITSMIFASKEYDEILKNELPKELSTYRFHDYGVDVLDNPHEKGDGVKFVLNYLDINKDNAAAFGDDLGDISMFEEVKYTYCMGNGKEELKKKAKMIIEPVMDHGVKKAIEKYIL